MVDWRLASQLGSFVAGDPPHAARPDLAEAAERSQEAVSAYTGLVAQSPLPAPELLSRPDWIEANLRSLRSLLDPLAERIGGAGVLGPPARAAGGVLLAAETGVLLGYVARRVLGQYELVLLDADAPPRLLFVGPNLDEAARAMSVDEDELLRWVTLHEVTHALQFNGVPWLRPHLAGLIRGLMSSMEVSLDPSRLARLPTRADLQAFVDAVAAGELLTLVAGPAQRRLLDHIQVTMAVLEGHAEHVMDAVGEPLLPSLGRLRAAMTRRREAQSPLSRLLSRLLGLEMKLRQYETGKRFCDGVVAEGGVAALNRVWASEQALPSLEELDDPARWVARTVVPTVTKL